MIEKNKKVAIFHCGFIYSGGGERIVLEEAKGLTKKGYGVEVFAPTLDRKLCFPDEMKNLRVKTFLPQFPSFIPARHAFTMLASAILAPFFAFRFKDIDIFLGANQPGAWIAFCVSKVLRKPYFVYLNQPNRILYHRKIDEAVKWQNLKEFYLIDDLIRKLRFFMSWADLVSFVSGKSMLVNGSYIGSVIKKIYKKNVIDCPAGAYPQNLKSLRLNPSTAYKGSFIIRNIKDKTFNIKKPYILLTNRHVPQKKFEYAIEALRLVKSKFKDIQLVIPSSFTPYTQELIDLVQKLGLLENVIFTEQISEEVLQKLYQNAAVYVYTAPEEDFGMGVIEAMGWGVPVVAWNYAGPTVTVRNGKTGYLAKPYKVKDFAQKIVSVLKDPLKRSEMGKNAWEHVSNNFSWKRHIDILEKAVNEALG